MALSKEQEDELAGLLAAVRKPPMPLSEKLSAAEIIRKWIGIIIVGIIVTVGFVYTVQNNTKRIAHLEAIDREMRPKTRTMWWMKESGLTNEEMKHQKIQAPDFTVLDYED